MPAEADALRPTALSWSLSWFLRQVRIGWWIVALLTLLGAVVGVLAAGQPRVYESSALLAVNAGTSTTETQTAVRSVASLVTSDVVVGAAADELGVDPDDLATRLRTVVRSGTTIIDVVVSGSDPDDVQDAATAVAEAALEENRSRQELAARAYQVAGEELLTKGTLSASLAEQARQQGIGTSVGEQQALTIQRAQAVSMVAPGSRGVPAGLGPTMALAFGAAAGAMLGLLLVLSGALVPLRRVHSGADLVDLGRGRRPRVAATPQAVAGALLQSGARYVALVSVGSPVPQRGPSAESRIVATLEQHGQRVALVEVGRDIELGAAAEVLSRKGRAALLAKADADVTVVRLDHDCPDIALLQGQADLACAIVVHRGARVVTVDDTLVPLAPADPILLFSRS